MPGMIKDRYSTYSEGVGKRIRDGKVRQLLLSRNPSLILQPCQRAAHHISASDSLSTARPIGAIPMPNRASLRGLPRLLQPAYQAPMVHSSSCCINSGLGHVRNTV
jgi:hypothetical protein